MQPCRRVPLLLLLPCAWLLLSPTILAAAAACLSALAAAKPRSTRASLFVVFLITVGPSREQTYYLH